MPISPSFQPMFTQVSNVTNNLAVSLLTHYSFDLGGYSASELVKRWESQHPSNWVHLAVIEALYQGRYKAISVQQILTLWLRRNYPSYHFNLEFESLICNKLPEDLKWNRLPPALPSMNDDFTVKEAIKNSQSSQIINSSSQTTSYQKSLERQQAIKTSIERQNQHTAELASDGVKENSNQHNRAKALPTSSSMSFSASKLSTDTNNTASPTLAETRNLVKDSELTPEVEAPLISGTLAKLLPPARNHPPIEQFTPEKSDSSDIFTSKMKAVIKK